MKSSLRILFMGTPEFAVSVLDKIINTNYNVVGVVTAPDRPAGRGRKLRSSAVSDFAEKNNLNLLKPENLKDDEFLSKIRALNIDVIVVVAFRMLPKVLWSIPKKGTFNLHASLLPQYRGAAPINWAIVNGETESGVTTFLIDEKIDTGNILLKKSIDINPDDTAGDLHDKLMHIGADLVVETLEGLENNTILPKPQIIDKELKSAPKLFKENTKIDWTQSLEKVYNLIRGLSPYPTAWTILSTEDESKTLKIYSAKIIYERHFEKTGRLISKDGKLLVAHSEGYISLKEIQLEGKRKMKAKDFLNGFDITKDSFVELY